MRECTPHRAGPSSLDCWEKYCASPSHLGGICPGGCSISTSFALEPPPSPLPTRIPGPLETTPPPHCQGALSTAQLVALQTDASLLAPASHFLSFWRQLQTGTSLELWLFCTVRHKLQGLAGPTHSQSYKDNTDPGGRATLMSFIRHLSMALGSDLASAHLLCNLSKPQFPHL